MYTGQGEEVENKSFSWYEFLIIWDGSTYHFKAVCLGVSRDCTSFLCVLHSVRLKGRSPPVLKSKEFCPVVIRTSSLFTWYQNAIFTLGLSGTYKICPTCGDLSQLSNVEARAGFVALDSRKSVCSYYSLNCVLSKNMLKSLPPVPQDVTLFGNKVFTDVIQIRGGH